MRTGSMAMDSMELGPKFWVLFIVGLVVVLGLFRAVGITGSKGPGELPPVSHHSKGKAKKAD